MSENIEKNFSSSIFGREKETPKPKGDEPPEEHEEELPPPKRTKESREIEEKALTKEAQKEYPKEWQEITELAKRVGFDKVLVISKRGISVFLKSPEIIFLPKSYLDHYREVTELIPPEDVNHRGLGLKTEDINRAIILNFFDIKNWFNEPKRKILRESDEKEEELERLENEKTKNEKELIKKLIGRPVLEENIDKLGRQLYEDKRSTLSESEIKEEALKLAIKNILYDGVKNGRVVKIAYLKELIDKKKISFDDYQKQLSEVISPEIYYIRKYYPFLGEDTNQNFIKEWLKDQQEIGKKYLEHEEKKSKNGLEMMYQ